MDSKEIINVFKYFELLQTELLEKIQNHEDCADIKNNKWSRDSENFGNALILEKGAVFDKIALNISHVKGNELRSSASIKNKDLKKKTLFFLYFLSKLLKKFTKKTLPITLFFFC